MNKLQTSTNILLTRIDNKIKQKKAEIISGFCKEIETVKFTADVEGWYAAVCEYGNYCKLGQCTTLPLVVRYATCIAPSCNNIPLPMLIPTSETILFDVSDRQTEVPKVMQSMMMRLLASMKPGLLKVTAIDRDFGSDFPFLYQLKSSIPGNHIKIVSTDSEISDLMNQLIEEVRSAFTSMSGYNDIDKYNANSSYTPRPYHLVLVDDFPSGFSQQSLSILSELLRNSNARRAGVLFVINVTSGSKIDRTANRVALNGRGFFNYSLATVLDDPSSCKEWLNALTIIKQKKVTASLDGWVDQLKLSKQIWSSTTIDGIRVPVGFTKQGTIFDFYIAGDTDSKCNDFFALLTGAPNMGKSSLLHNIIINSSLKYSPEELRLYLVDFSNGATFNIYRNLPHAKALMLTNNKEYAIRIMDDIEEECSRRARLYEEATSQSGRIINKLSDYRTVTGSVMPRILLVIDEFQVLFQSHDTFTEAARDKLCNGIRQWRKFGVSVVLSTQSLSGVNFGEDTQSNITYRFAMRQSMENSKMTLRNGAASHLTVPGQTIMNNSFDGSEDKNVEFQCAWSEKHGEQVHYLSSLYAQKYRKHPIQFVCDSSLIADMATNSSLMSILNKKGVAENTVCDVYVGKPDLLREAHTKIRIKRQRGSNILILGDDYSTIKMLIPSMLMQLHMQSPADSMFLLADCFNPGDEYYGSFDGMNDYLPAIKVVHGTETGAVIGRVWDIMQRRKGKASNGEFEQERIVLAIVNSHDCESLRPIDNGRFSEQSEASRKLLELLREGPQMGIHSIIHTETVLALFDGNSLGLKNSSQLFSNIVMLRGSDGGNLWDVGRVPEVDTPGRAVVINGRIDNERYEQCMIYNRCSVTSSEIQLVVDNYLTSKYNKK